MALVDLSSAQKRLKDKPYQIYAKFRIRGTLVYISKYGFVSWKAGDFNGSIKDFMKLLS